jgi:calnexin
VPQGPWKQRQIPNPAYFKVDNPLELLAPIAAVAFELWTTDRGYTFDSVMLGSGEAGIAAAAAYMRDIWRPRNHAEVRRLLSATYVSSSLHVFLAVLCA